MMTPLSTYKTYDIIVAPFSFIDIFEKTKLRPLVIISHTFFDDKSICAMITSANHPDWLHDVEIKNLESCGLIKPCLIRFKLFTIDHDLIQNKIGQLSRSDQLKVRLSLDNIFQDPYAKKPKQMPNRGHLRSDGSL